MIFKNGLKLILFIFTFFLNSDLTGADQSKTSTLDPIHIDQYRLTFDESLMNNPFDIKAQTIDHRVDGKKVYLTGLFHKFHTFYGSYTYYVPHQIDLNKPCMLVIALHGLNQSAKQYIGTWINSAYQNNFIILAPQSSLPGGRWHIRDAERILSLFKKFVQIYPIDNQKILLSGFSEGAHFAYYLGLNYPENFTALSSICGKIENAWKGLILFTNEKSNQIPIFSINGRKDQVIWDKEVKKSWNILSEFDYPHTTWMIDHLEHHHDPSLNKTILEWFEKARIQEIDITDQKPVTRN